MITIIIYSKLCKICRSQAMNATEPKARAGKSTGEVRLGISAAKLLPLLAYGNLHAADFRCLDARSQQAIRRLLLAACRF
jgi:hypothetical protein